MRKHKTMSTIVKNANLILIFLGGIIVTGFFKDETVVASVPILVALGAFLGIVFNRTKHLDDLNMTRKKDVSLSFVEDISEYGAVLTSIIEHSTTLDSFFSDLTIASKKMISSLNKFHVVCSDEASSKIELLHFELSELMQVISKKAATFHTEPDKLKLMADLIESDIFSKLNIVRFKIIDIINNEIGDGSGKKEFKAAIEKNNTDYKAMLYKVLEIPDK